MPQTPAALVPLLAAITTTLGIEGDAVRGIEVTTDATGVALTVRHVGDRPLFAGGTEVAMCVTTGVLPWE